jgi:uncharacterized alkaline shock family protein YloU
LCPEVREPPRRWLRVTEPISQTQRKSPPDEFHTPVGAKPQTGAREQAATRGRTTIADGVVEKIAGIATREVPGIHALGGGFSRSMGAVRDRVPGARSSAGRGVRVEVGEKQTAIDLEVVVEYGVSVTEVAADVRENVIAAVERMAGLEVVEVNISVNDVHLPEEDAPESSEGRVQ